MNTKEWRAKRAAGEFATVDTQGKYLRVWGAPFAAALEIAREFVASATAATGERHRLGKPVTLTSGSGTCFGVDGYAWPMSPRYEAPVDPSKPRMVDGCWVWPAKAG